MFRRRFDLGLKLSVGSQKRKKSFSEDPKRKKRGKKRKRNKESEIVWVQRRNIKGLFK
jgi:hypothetical protein